MPVLFLAIMAGDAEAVRRLLLCGARTDIPLPPEARIIRISHLPSLLSNLNQIYFYFWHDYLWHKHH